MPRALFGVTVAGTAHAFLRNQLAALVASGWEVHLAVSPDDHFRSLGELEGVRIHKLPMSRPPDPARDIRSLISWIKLVRVVQPDIVVVGTPKAGLLGMIAARIYTVPVRVYHLRGLRAEGLNGLSRIISLASERLAIKCATDLLCDSETLLTLIEDLGLAPPEKGIVLGSGSCCGVDVQRFRPPTDAERQAARADLGLSERDVAVGFVGRITSDKGIPELLSAFAQVHDEFPDSRLLLTGPVEDEQALSSLAEADYSGRVVLRPPVTDVTATYWALDVFCLPSHREGFAISNLEAQASGLPVVTTDATGCSDGIAPGISGLSVPVGDVALLRDSLASLVRDQELRVEMGRQGRIRVVKHFDMKSVTTEHVKYFTSLVQRSC